MSFSTPRTSINGKKQPIGVRVWYLYNSMNLMFSASQRCDIHPLRVPQHPQTLSQDNGISMNNILKRKPISDPPSSFPTNTSLHHNQDS